MKNLMDIIERTEVPEPWAEGEKIPWNEPGFSERMLKEHLSQEHDGASRRFGYVDAHVDWIHRELLGERPSRVLDLGCGPGLYTSRLARLGHTCTGIDFSPASVAYARAEAEKDGLDCTYVHQDVRTADYGTGFDLVMFIYGESDVFRPEDAETILHKALDALSDGGMLLLEVHRLEALEKWGKRGRSWYSSPSGLFSDRPHLHLEEHFWDGERCVTMIRNFIVDAETGEVTFHAQSIQAYTPEQHHALLAECGFVDVVSHPSLVGGDNFILIVARKPGT